MDEEASGKKNDHTKREKKKSATRAFSQLSQANKSQFFNQKPKWWWWGNMSGCLCMCVLLSIPSNYSNDRKQNKHYNHFFWYYYYSTLIFVMVFNGSVLGKSYNFQHSLCIVWSKAYNFASSLFSSSLLIRREQATQFPKKAHPTTHSYYFFGFFGLPCGDSCKTKPFTNHPINTHHQQHQPNLIHLMIQVLQWVQRIYRPSTPWTRCPLLSTDR